MENILIFLVSLFGIPAGYYGWAVIVEKNRGYRVPTLFFLTLTVTAGFLYLRLP